MTVNRALRIVAGLFVFISVALGAPASPVYVSGYWLWFTVFVGLNLLQSGLTGWCLMETVLRKAGLPESETSKS